MGKQWVNYFLHAGHLNIHGFKMSKSLKNFITIQQALETHTARQIRMCFLLHKYNLGMDYGDSTMAEAITMDNKFHEFFQNMKIILRTYSLSGSQHLDENAKILFLKFETLKENIYDALADDFDIPSAILHMQTLMKDTYKYLDYFKDKVGTNDVPKTTIISSIAKYLTKMLRVWGLVTGSQEIGFGSSSSSTGVNGASTEEILTPYLEIITKFRESIRKE